MSSMRPTGVNPALIQSLDYPLTTLFHQLSVAPSSRGIYAVIFRQCPNDDVCLPQFCNSPLQVRITLSGCPHGLTAFDLALTQRYQGAYIKTEASGRTCPPEIAANGIVTATLADGITMTRYIGCKHQPRMVVVATQLAEIEPETDFREIPFEHFRHTAQLIQRRTQGIGGPT